MPSSKSSKKSNKDSKFSSRLSLGKNGEEHAVQHLESNGYHVLHQNWRAGRTGEIDLIALTPDSTTLVFIEVKTRSSARYGHPIESVTPAKQLKILRVAEHYLHECPFAGDIRFDVVSILLKEASQPELSHIENAFDAG